jgi:hypothetical protein
MELNLLWLQNNKNLLIYHFEHVSEDLLIQG